MSEPKMVRVEWLDARSVYEQMELSAAVDRVLLAHRFSVGYLVKRTKEELLICGTFDPAEKKVDRDQTPDEDGGADFTIIPRSWVQKVIELHADAAEKPDET